MIPSVDTMKVWSHDEVMMSCPACAWTRNLGHDPTVGEIKEAAVQHRFEHQMSEGVIKGGTER